MSINLPVFEIITILFFMSLFKWLFRFGIMILIVKVMNSLKERGKESLKEFQENIKGKEEE